MNIDAHQHFWRYAPTTHAWIDDSMSALKRDFLPDDLAPLLRAVRIRRLRSPCRRSRTSPRRSGCSSLAAQHDVHPRRRRLGRPPRDRRRRRSSLALAVNTETPRRAPRRAGRAGRSLHAAPGISAWHRRAGPPFGLTYDILIYARQLPAAVDLVGRFPAAALRARSHRQAPTSAPGGSTTGRSGITRLAAFPNVACKLSGMVTEGDWHTWQPGDFDAYLDVVIGAFGRAVDDRLRLAGVHAGRQLRRRHRHRARLHRRDSRHPNRRPSSAEPPRASTTSDVTSAPPHATLAKSGAVSVAVLAKRSLTSLRAKRGRRFVIPSGAKRSRGIYSVRL